MPSYTVDRFEAETAVLENDRGETVNVPRAQLPAGAREGSVLTSHAVASGAPAGLVLDAEATAKRLTDVRRLRDQLASGPRGDISL